MAGWSRRPRAWFAVGGCLVVWSALLSTGAPLGPAPDGPVTVRAVPGASLRLLQMNLCGSGAAGCYTGRSVLEASAVIRAQAPDVVTVNEVCRDDVATLERTLAATGRERRGRVGVPGGVGPAHRRRRCAAATAGRTASGWSPGWRRCRGGTPRSAGPTRCRTSATPRSGPGSA